MKITFFVFMLSLTYLQAEEEVNFRRDIRPILSDRCFHCHGPDEETREGHIRFDIPDGKEGAFRVRKKRAAIVPGKPQKSHLYLRLITDDDDDVMPPLDSHKVALTVKEKENFKKWIEQGAKWSGHWAFEAPVKPAVPALKKTQWARNTIDAFIMKRLEKEGLGVSPEAPRYKLIRRLSYDLTGLPPTPQEERNFIKDKSAKAYEKVVEKFLAKPSYGERMALPWLDMARYGDSSVYHADGPRTMWPWRDWVIKAYNDYKPFDEFTLEQIGGDHIKKRTDDQHLATAFLRNNGTTDEGGAFFEEYRVEYTVDRLATVSKVWLGLTTECAQCHDHKYDPISQKEFFQMYAFFNVAADPGKQSRKGNQAPILSLPLPQPQLDLLAKLQKQISAIEKTQEHHKKLNKQLFAKWTKQQTRGRIKAPGFTKYLRHYFPLNSTQNLSDYIEASKLTYQGKSHKIQQKADRFGETRDKSKKDQVGKSIYFNGQKTVHGQKTSWIDTTTPFSISVWVKHFKSKSPQVLISKLDNHKKGSGRGYELLIKDDKVCFSLNSDRAKNILHIESIKTLEAQKWHYITVTYDARKKAAGLKVYINAQPAKTKILKDSLKGSVTNKAQLIIGGRGKDRFMGWVNHLQIYDIALTRKDIVRSAKAGFGEFLFQGFSGENTRLFAKIKDHYFDSLDKNFMALNQKKKKVNDQLNIAKRFKLNVMVMEDQKKPRKTYILDRGAYDSPQKEQIHPSTPAALPPMIKEY
ncbi:MAG: DUF1549 domain-containing protein, partial [Lentisphaeraceae bacterium]|nr:DUF1549 domain-containing protein [Lentisphaeraceae bacterium]